jgi:hypothetical protein
MSRPVKPRPGAAAYLRFLNLVEAIRSPALPPLDTTEERLLNVLGAAWHEGRRVTVLEAMQMLPDASSTTVHRRLNALRSKGLLANETDAQDSRVRYLVPTAAAMNYFEELGKCLTRANAR